MAYSKEQIENIFQGIIDKISLGESLRAILREKGAPSSKTFYRWLNEDEAKVKQYARATEERADAIFEEILEIADEPNADVFVDKVTGKIKIDGDVIQRSKLKVEARKWMLSKMNPKKYGTHKFVEQENTEVRTVKYKVINGDND